MKDIDKALISGFILLLFIPGILFLVSAIIIWYFSDIHPFISMIIGLIVGIILAWICWSIFSPIWKIWAFSYVKDKQELYNRAVAGQLIWPNRSIYNYTEIKFPNQKRKIEILFSDIDTSNPEYNEDDADNEDYADNEDLIENRNDNGLIKNYTNLIGAVLVLISAVFLQNRNNDIEYKDLCCISSRLNTKPELYGKNSDKWIRIIVDNYEKEFKIQGFVLKAMCETEFLEIANENKEIKLFVSNKDTINLNKKTKFNNYNNIYQIIINDKEYVSLKLRNKLETADMKIFNYLYVISCILALYSFFYKPKINVRIIIIITIIIALYQNKIENKEIYRLERFENKCSEIKG